MLEPTLTNQSSATFWSKRFRTPLLLFAIVLLGFCIRSWRFIEYGEIDEDDAIFIGRTMMLFNRATLWGWINILETDYGIGVLLANAVNYTILKLSNFAIDERTIQYQSLFFGVMGIVSIYWAVREIIQNRLPTLIVALLIALMPYQVVMSRSIGGNWTMSAFLVWWLLALCAKYAKTPTKSLALISGLVLALYLQTDGMQAILLAFIPILFVLLGNRKHDGANFFAIHAFFGLILVFGSLVFAPPVLRWAVGVARFDDWNTQAIQRLSIYCLVFGINGMLVMALAWLTRVIRYGPPWEDLFSRCMNPLFFIPVNLSLALNVAVAWSTFYLQGVPHGVLGHALAKDVGPGWYIPIYFRDILIIMGWPMAFLAIFGLPSAIAACRKSIPVLAMGIWALLNNLPWLFLVPHHATNRTYSMLVATASLLTFSVIGLLQNQRIDRSFAPGARITAKLIFGSVVLLCVVFATTPFTIAQVTLEPTFGISAPYSRGSNLPSRGVRPAFDYFVEYAKPTATVFTDVPHWVARFYLFIKHQKGFRKESLIALPCVPYTREASFYSFFENKGKNADWYIVSSRFVERVQKRHFEGMGLQFTAEGSRGEMQVWQRGYAGPIKRVHVSGGERVKDPVPLECNAY